MSTDETLVQLDFDEDQDLFIDRKPINPNNAPIIHRSKTSDTPPNIRVSTATTHTSTVSHQLFHNHNHLATSATSAVTSNSSHLFNDRHSSISLSSSSDAEAVCLVPEVGFDNINLEGGDSRESQPLLGGRDQPDIVFNHFPGRFVLNIYTILPVCESLEGFPLVST